MTSLPPPPHLRTLQSRTPLSTQEPPEPGQRPWWRWGLPGLGQQPELTRQQRRLLNVLSTVNLVDNYDLGLLGLALPQIQAGLLIPDDQLGGMSAVIRLGVLPAVCLSALADGIGRRRVLLVTILGFTVMTALTALAQTASQFMLLQFLARVFMATEAVLAIVVLAEAFGAHARGWGLGVLGAVGALGHGVASLVFAVVTVLPFGWRALYLLGVAPLLLLAWVRRSLEETPRFEAHHGSRGNLSPWREALRPFHHLVRMYPSRVLALGSALFCVSFCCEPAVFFASKTLQQVRHYSPVDVTLLYLTAGIAAPLGNLVAGRYGDRCGRKGLLIAGVVLNTGAVAAFYQASNFWAPIAWSLMLFSLMLVNVLFAALGAELFPTSHRATASGVRAVLATAGAALGLVVEGLLFQHRGSHSAAIMTMLLSTPIAPVLVVLFLPETASRELEEIAPERAAS